MTGRGPEPPIPADLGEAGTALWRRLTDAYEFAPWELTVVELVVRQCDDLDLLDRAIRDGGIMAAGSQGQTRLAQVVGEARQARASIARLLGQLHLPADSVNGEQSLTAAGRRGQKAAAKRWENVAKLPRGKGADRGETA